MGNAGGHLDPEAGVHGFVEMAEFATPSSLPLYLVCPKRLGDNLAETAGLFPRCSRSLPPRPRGFRPFPGGRLVRQTLPTFHLRVRVP
jgi:hypothetical protein